MHAFHAQDIFVFAKPSCWTTQVAWDLESLAKISF
jgi:hypothetical protein